VTVVVEGTSPVMVVVGQGVVAGGDVAIPVPVPGGGVGLAGVVVLPWQPPWQLVTVIVEVVSVVLIV
jgi:hypothetical protein